MERDVTLLKSKIHQATVTGVDVGYEGSIVIDSSLMEEVGLHRYEKVLVSNLNNGARWETYVIEAEPGSGAIRLNGATARLGQVQDRIIVFAFATLPESLAATISPKIILLDENNRIVRRSFAE